DDTRAGDLGADDSSAASPSRWLEDSESEQASPDLGRWCLHPQIRPLVGPAKLASLYPPPFYTQAEKIVVRVTRLKWARRISDGNPIASPMKIEFRASVVLGCKGERYCRVPPRREPCIGYSWNQTLACIFRIRMDAAD